MRDPLNDGHSAVRDCVHQGELPDLTTAGVLQVLTQREGHGPISKQPLGTRRLQTLDSTGVIER